MSRKKVFQCINSVTKQRNMSEVSEEKTIDQVVESTTTEETIVETTKYLDDQPIAMEEVESTPAVEYPPNVHKLHRQLVAIFDPENLKKDNFFRELVERDSEGCKFFDL
jgi:hypothetical protein